MRNAKIKTNRELVQTLNAFKPGFLPFDVFVAIARLVTLPIVEMVPLRLRDGAVEVLLLERSPDDHIWPGMVHSPGTVIRATDADGDLFGAFARIIHDELHDTAVSEQHFVGSMFHTSRRGTEYAQIYWLEVVGEPRVGKFYPVDALPDNLIEDQEKFINLAARNFQETRAKLTGMQA